MSRDPYRLTLYALLICALIVSGCTGPASINPSVKPDDRYPLSAVDDIGRSISFDSSPLRMISLSPSTTEILYALGLEDRIVGLDEYSDFPPMTASKPKLGGMINVTVEKVKELNPDCVFVGQFTPNATVEKLESMGIKVFGLHPDNITDTYRIIKLIGEICDVPEEARQLNDIINETVSNVTQRVSTLNKTSIPDVLVVITLDAYVADPDNYMGDVLKTAGANNVATGPVMTPEEIVKADPDIIIVPLTDWTQATYDSLKNGTEPWMKNLTAVKTGHIYSVDYSTLGRPGPRTGEAILMIARVLHPEIF